MRKPLYASKNSRAQTGWWEHPKPFGKRSVNKSERSGFKSKAKNNLESV